MNLSLRQIFYEHRILFLWILALTLNIITLLLAIGAGSGSRTVVLHYNVLVGAQVFGRGYELYNIPFIGFFIFALNVSLFHFLRNKHPFLSEAGSVLAVLTSFVLLSAMLFLRSLG